jgi:2-dehydro-3-deoxygalactonokinase
MIPPDGIFRSVKTSSARLLALDWGTSALRAYLLGEHGAVLEERSRPWGIMHLPEGGFAAALEAIAGDWQAATPGLSIIACGMVGSAQGLREAPYVSCPAGRDALSAGLVAVEIAPGLRLHIVPGVRRDGDPPDVMRGEETQVMGALAQAKALGAHARLVMPGTHSKWVQVEDGCIVDFQTYMTGELFALLKDHSILGRPARNVEASAGASSEEAFKRGVSAVHKRPGAGGTELLFSTRTLVLTGQLKAEDSLDYLSGLLVGEELRCALMGRPSATRGPVALIGETALCARYLWAMSVFGMAAGPILQGAAPHGLWQLAQQAGLCPDAGGA